MRHLNHLPTATGTGSYSVSGSQDTIIAMLIEISSVAPVQDK